MFKIQNKSMGQFYALAIWSFEFVSYFALGISGFPVSIIMDDKPHGRCYPQYPNTA
jgi:hypothetical protein